MLLLQFTIIKLHQGSSREVTPSIATLLLPFSVNLSIRIAQDYMDKWELACPKLLESSTLFKCKLFHPRLKGGVVSIRVSSLQFSAQFSLDLHSCNVGPLCSNLQKIRTLTDQDWESMLVKIASHFC
jgi:hypothetical protein